MGALLDSRQNTDARNNLANVIASERPLALVGAGLSMPAGFPTWSGLLEEIEQLLPPLNNDYKEALRKEGDFLWRAEEYRHLIGDGPYQLLLRKRFGTPVTLKASDSAVALVRLPFRHFMTTNYDDVLLKAHDVAELQHPRVLNWSRDDDVRAFIFSLRDGSATRLLLHLHGHHSDPKSIILTDNDYTDRYVRTFDTAHKLFAIFTTERIVFAGFSLNDPDLMALLREVNATLRSDEARHFAIMGLEHPISEALERNRLRRRYGVEPVFYDNSDKTHNGLIEVLASLEQYVSANVPATAQPKVLRRAAGEVERTVEAAVESYPDDPQKGKWGGRSEVNGRQISADVREIEPGWFEAAIIVRSTDSGRPLIGEVVFHLHPTIWPSIRRATVNEGVASINVESYGAYTVGVEADGGKTHLELDLAELESAPMMFRLN